jgi:hypothetical protein
MECGGNFKQHLANGDPIDRPTKNEPVGIPAGTWEECAIAAFELKGWLESDTKWDDKLVCLWRCERYNGFGYAQYHPDVPTPYLWSGTDKYIRVKYVSDGKWDPSAVSQQIGIVAIWAALGINLESKIVNLNEIELIENAVGTLTISQNTWIKTSTAAASNLPDTQKKEAKKNLAFPVFRRLEDLDRHYAIEIGIGRGMGIVYIWRDHASIEMSGDPSADDVGGVVEDLKPVVAAIPGKKEIQEHLIGIGLLDPIADGKWGSLSQSAWRAFTRVIGCESEDLSQSAIDRLVDFKRFKDLCFKPKDPDDAENILAVKCINRMIALGAHIAISMGSDKPTYNILHLTGTDPDGTKNSNKIDQWNDLRLVVEVSQSGLVIVKLCKLATCEPGRHWIDNPMNSKGTFLIACDKQWFAWSVGKHGSRQYPALVQVGEIEGYRDSDRNGSWSGETLMSGDYMGVNIHHGYDSDLVGQMSAGCQVGKSIAGHEEFMRLVKSDRRYVCNNGYRFGNISLDGSKL